MSDEIVLNCVGMKCPRPIIEIAKAARRSGSGTVLVVKSDDLAFESDVKAWCETTKASLVSIEKDGKTIKITIKLA